VELEMLGFSTEVQAKEQARMLFRCLQCMTHLAECKVGVDREKDRELETVYTHQHARAVF
jgi:hypothetical protein